MEGAATTPVTAEGFNALEVVEARLAALYGRTVKLDEVRLRAARQHASKRNVGRSRVYQSGRAVHREQYEGTSAESGLRRGSASA